jgi:hypothetical protein
MNNTLQIFSAITTHLVSLTGYNESRRSKSKGIKTFDDLAAELNTEGILTPRQVQWTGASLRKFISRCRETYPVSELKQLCPLELIGAQHHEFLAKDQLLRSGKIIRFNRSLYKENI